MTRYRYYIRPDTDQADWSEYYIVDERDGGYGRNSARYVARCADPEMAQRIADLLNKEEANGDRSKPD